jgi:hypothetical protein
VGYYVAVQGDNHFVKTIIPAVIGLYIFAHSCWMIHRGRSSYSPPNTTYKVEITVTGPDGQIIKPIARAPR